MNKVIFASVWLVWRTSACPPALRQRPVPPVMA
jgi:hypothetical protein